MTNMEPWIQTAITVICAVLATNGFWAFLQARRNSKDAKTKMILGLGYDRIINLCSMYIERGWITHEEYEDLNKYLFKPYTDMGGNGTAEHMMEAVKKLPMKAGAFPHTPQVNN